MGKMTYLFNCCPVRNVIWTFRTKTVMHHYTLLLGRNDFPTVNSSTVCNPNVQNGVGDTPLHIASCMKKLRNIKLLLGRKCRTNIPNNTDETAQDISLNVAGDCQWGDVRYLITDESVSLPKTHHYTHCS